MIHLTRHSNRIWLASRYSEEIKLKCAAQPGAGWATGPGPKAWAIEAIGYGAKGVWTFPLNYRMCMDLRREFRKEEIEIHPPLWKWAAEERAKREALKHILTQKEMPTPILEVEYPRLAEAVHNYAFQSVGIAYAIRAGKALIGDHPGLGKTLQAASAAVEAQIRGACLVSAPTQGQMITWPDEFAEWLPGERFHLIVGSKDKRRRLLDEFWAAVDADKGKVRHWAFINHEMLQNDRQGGVNSEGVRVSLTTAEPRFPALFARPWQLIVMDESHLILPTKSSLARDQSLKRRGAQDLALMPHGLKLALSGTPWRGNPLNMWGTLHWLYPSQYPGYWAYVMRWFEVSQGTNAYTGLPEGPKEIGDLIRSQTKDFGEELDCIMIRRTKEEVDPQRPAKRFGGVHLIPGDVSSPIGVWLEMTGKQRRIYEEMVDNAIANVENGTIIAAGRLSELVRLTQFASSYGELLEYQKRIPGKNEFVDKATFSPLLPSNKFDWLREFTEERGILRPKDAWGDSKVIVVSQYTKLLNLFSELYTKAGIPNFLFTGEVKQSERPEIKRRFQSEGGPRIVFLNTTAGGTSLTLDAADDMVTLDDTWDPDQKEQVINRIDRLIIARSKTIWDVRSRGTIDEYRATRSLSRDRVQKALLDERRGVQVFRQLLGRAA